MKAKRKTTKEIIQAVLESDSIRECILKLYDNKNVSTHTYRLISKIMIEWGISFKNGSNYIHPSLKDFYEETLKNKNTLTVGKNES